jgi:hypothetical protein
MSRIGRRTIMGHGAGHFKLRGGNPMFNRSVVFIVGAGASISYGMPLGGMLASTIAADTDFLFEAATRLADRGATTAQLMAWFDRRPPAKPSAIQECRSQAGDGQRRQAHIGNRKWLISIPKTGVTEGHVISAPAGR